jgi:hypothetical protein
MQKRRYEILLPLRYNDGRMVEGEAFEKTREELIAEFSAISLMPESVRGIWIRDGTRYEDELLRFVVDVEDTLEHREFFGRWKVSLLERFQQLEIYITSQAIEVI